MWDTNSKLASNSLLPGLAMLREMDHLGGFLLAAVPYLILISQSARCSQLLRESSFLTDAYEGEEGPNGALTSSHRRGVGAAGCMVTWFPTGRDFSRVRVTLVEPEQFMLLLFSVAYSPNLLSKTISKNRNISVEAQPQSGLGVFLKKDVVPPGLRRVETYRWRLS